MRALVQRVTGAAVSVAGETAASIGPGFVVLLGVASVDTADDARKLASKCAALRIFDDDNGKMNRSIVETGGEALVVSQFTLYADASRGNRPGFAAAAPPDAAFRLYEEYLAALRSSLGEERVRTGVFRAMMQVSLVNDGPVTILLETEPR